MGRWYCHVLLMLCIGTPNAAGSICNDVGVLACKRVPACQFNAYALQPCITCSTHTSWCVAPRQPQGERAAWGAQAQG